MLVSPQDCNDLANGNNVYHVADFMDAWLYVGGSFAAQVAPCLVGSFDLCVHEAEINLSFCPLALEMGGLFSDFSDKEDMDNEEAGGSTGLLMPGWVDVREGCLDPGGHLE